ncbi:hypothetical protein B2J93_5729 [Marssonina coronariae]|uniref:Amine oxidase n=1 Tax=Diplocarpon coronariae TaxID=2795749 RepID=A0A218Z2H2_9HELO|nr:hypothetical protein B2J93_5729 [Marssonina coronariae]
MRVPKRGEQSRLPATNPRGSQICAAPGAQAIEASHANFWIELSSQETASVAAWLFSQSQYNLTVTADAGEWDNSLLLIELMPPKKTDVLAHIDSRGGAPARYAHVIINHRASEEPTYQDLLAGPLPLQNATVTSQPLIYPYTRKTDGKVRNLDADEAKWEEWKTNVTTSILEITLDSWNGSLLGLDNDTLTVFGVDPLWQDDGDTPALDTQFPPNYVKWMDFEFYTPFSRDNGLSLYGVKYKGERIIYELGLQEALAHYVGNDPIQSGTSYQDTFYGFWRYAFELVKGYACPSYATYLNSSFYNGETTDTHIDSICLFETEANYPIQQHSTSGYVSATKNVYFTTRTLSTVGNYDYMVSYEFYCLFLRRMETMDINHDARSGSMHDHVLNFKIDFDILGTSITMTTATHVATSEVYPWSQGKKRNTMKLERATVETEDTSRLNWASNGATAFTVVNTDGKNIYGESRGYALYQSSPTIHLTVRDSRNLEKSASWAKHDLYVTRQHDTEPRSSHPYQSQDVFNPPVDFDAFFDGESLQEDLVVWANVGTHHVPHTGDLPNTVLTTAHSSLVLSPVKSLMGSPSRETVNMIQILYGGEQGTTVETFGQGTAECAVRSVQGLLPDLRQCVGDKVVGNFPCEPDKPSYETESI